MIEPFDPSPKVSVEKFLLELDELIITYGGRGITSNTFHGIFSFCAQVQLDAVTKIARKLSDSEGAQK